MLDTSRTEHVLWWCSRRAPRRQASAHISFRHAAPGRGGGERCSHREQGPRRQARSSCMVDEGPCAHRGRWLYPESASRRSTARVFERRLSGVASSQDAGGMRARDPEDFVADRRPVLRRLHPSPSRHAVQKLAIRGRPTKVHERLVHEARDGLSCQASAGAKRGWIRAGYAGEPGAARTRTWMTGGGRAPRGPPES
jgi:hypothetical protein